MNDAAKPRRLRCPLDLRPKTRLRARIVAVPNWLLAATAIVLSMAASGGCEGSKSATPPDGAAAGKPAADAWTDAVPPTFSRDICPIVFAHCAVCHRPDGSGPFSLLTYADVKKRSSQIAKVTHSRFMPPWLPKESDYEFIGDYHLTDRQIDTIRAWVAAGCAEGNLADAPPQPKWSEGWQLGEPDLVVQMPEPYHLSPGGTDVWRRFVIPVPVAGPRYVRAVEIRPGSKRIVHHAIAYIDSTDSSRRLESKTGEPGYDGMITSDAHSPDGHFLSWLPGMIPYAEDPEMAWRLEPGTDFVVETHMLPSGKPETVQISIGVYFTDQPPSKFPVRLLLHSEEIDIPAGSTDFAVADSYVLPVEAQLLGMHPHAHLLGKEVEAWATLPDGTKRSLLSIPHWDFAWQNSYRLKTPLTLPAGTRLSMQIRFDNSANNVRNPHHPPERVHFGFHSYDEMAQMTVQVLPRNAAEARKLAGDFRQRDLLAAIKGDEFRLQFEGDNERLQTDLGKDLFAVGRRQEGIEHLQTALKIKPAHAPAHYALGQIYLRANAASRAKSEFEAAIQADPDFYLAQAELGELYLEQGDFDRAKEYLTRSLKIRPQDAVTRNNLAIVYFQQGSVEAAYQQIVESLRIDPDYGPARDNLKKLEAIRQR